MIGFLRHLFVVQYDYREAARAMRARILLPLTGTIAVLALVAGAFLIVAAVTDIGPRTTVMESGSILAPILVLVTGFALWLTQRGALEIASGLVGLLLAGLVGYGLLIGGLEASPVLILSIFLTFMALVYGAQGAALATLLAWIALPVIAYLQSEGRLSVETAPFDELLTNALASAGIVTLSAMLLWIFAWNLHGALERATGIAAQTRTTAAASQAISRILNLNELLTQAVDLIRDRFAFFHVQIFLLDDSKSYANLVSSTGDIGNALLAQGFRVPVGPRTVVGDAIANNQPHYIPDLTQTSFRHPELLANTRTELVVPLVIGEEVIGALDIQSMRTDAFHQEDIEAMQIMANQIGQAIQNARLFESQQQGMLQNRRLFLESETNLREIERLNRQLTGQSWKEYMFESGAEQFGINLDEDDVQADVVAWTPAMQQAADRNRMVSRQDGDDQILAVPVSIRGQPIGAIEVRLTGPHNQSEIRNMIQSVAERMAFSLENVRLFEQARMAAERERQINAITAQLQGLTTIENVLTTAISALGQTLNADSGTIRMISPEATVPDRLPDNGKRSETDPGHGPLIEDQNP